MTRLRWAAALLSTEFVWPLGILFAVGEDYRFITPFELLPILYFFFEEMGLPDSTFKSALDRLNIFTASTISSRLRSDAVPFEPAQIPPPTGFDMS